jgi:protoporphyrinogen oxidase
MANPLHVAVIGGGISGLASAFRLAERGARVTLLESGRALGGLAASFEVRGVHLEKFYHCLLPSDAALLDLLGTLGLGGRVHWQRTGMGFMHRGRIHPMNTALDLLRFEPLAWGDRLRMGWMGLRAQRRRDHAALDRITVADYLRRGAGPRAYERVWKPLLTAKLGDAHAGIPALWFVSRIQREKGSQKETKGFVDGGYHAIVGALAQALAARGATIRFGARVAAVERDGAGVTLRLEGGERADFDAVVATTPLIEFQRMTAGLGLARPVADLKLDYQGVVSGVFLLRRPLSRYYWMPFVDSGATSQGVIEMSNLVPPERSHGLYVTYLVNYTHRTSSLYLRDDAELLAAYRADLARLFAGADEAIADQFLFRAPFVEPMWPLGYRETRPDPSVIPGRLYLACTAQVYPNVNSWNSCCEVVDRMVAAFDREVETRR